MELINSFWQKKVTIASFHIKLRSHWFRGCRKTDSEGEDLVLQLISQIKTKVLKFENDYIPQNLTQVPNFDIAFEEIFPELENQEFSKFAHVSANLHILKDLFGFRNLKSLFDIENQSFFTLEAAFPELHRKVRKSEIKIDYLKFSNPVKRYILDEPSRIICDRDAAKVSVCDYQIREVLPNYLKTHSWELAFDRFVDGCSLN